MNNPPEGPVGPPAQTLPARTVEATEAAETVPELLLTVTGLCNNPIGRYVGLNKGQREQLQVEIGGVVELVGDDGRSIGVFIVGSGSKTLLHQPDAFTANCVETGKTYKVRRPKSGPQESDTELSVRHAVETQDPEKHERHKGIIEIRLKLDPELYVVIPGALAHQMGIRPPQGKTIASISTGRIKGVDGNVREIPVVPAGSEIGFTTKAAQQLGIPHELKSIRVRVEDGILVIS